MLSSSQLNGLGRETRARTTAQTQCICFGGQGKGTQSAEGGTTQSTTGFSMLLCYYPLTTEIVIFLWPACLYDVPVLLIGIKAQRWPMSGADQIAGPDGCWTGGPHSKSLWGICSNCFPKNFWKQERNLGYFNPPPPECCICFLLLGS